MLVSPYKIVYSYKNAVNPVIKKGGNFKLLDKTQKLSVFDSHMFCFTPEKSETYSSITVGKNDDSGFKKKITTFFSKDGTVIRKVFESANQPTVIRDYEQSDLLLKNNKSAKFRKIISKIFDENTFNYRLDSVEEQKVFKSPNNDIKLQISKNLIKDSFIDASVTEFTKNASKKFNPNENKILSMKIALAADKPKIFDIFTKNIKKPKNDKFLPFRMIFADNLKKLSFAKFLLKEKGLDSLGIIIQFSKKTGDDVAAYFSEFESALVFNPLEKEEAIKLVAHEVEHAYQYCQIGRLGKGKSKFGMQSLSLKGEITNPKERYEALNFFVASEKYPQTSPNTPIGSQPEYFNNLLELDANKEAQKIYDEYIINGEDLAKQLFFGGF